MSFDDLKRKLSKNLANNLYDKFIHEVTFPKFKNFAPNTRIEFKYPITAIVGPNGGGKSTVLQALWGMSQRYSTSRFWFSTPVDPIHHDPKDQHRYWYTHYIKAINRRVQCRKMQGNKRNGYWEPTRPNISEGMEKMPASDERISELVPKKWTLRSEFHNLFFGDSNGQSHQKKIHRADQGRRGRASHQGGVAASASGAQF